MRAACTFSSYGVGSRQSSVYQPTYRAHLCPPFQHPLAAMSASSGSVRQRESMSSRRRRPGACLPPPRAAQALSRQPAVERACLVLVGVGCLRGHHWSNAVSPASRPVQLHAYVRPRNPMLHAGQQQRLLLRQPPSRLFSGLSHWCPFALARSVSLSVFSLLSLFCVAGGPCWFHCPLITALAIQPSVLRPRVFDIGLPLVSTLHCSGAAGSETRRAKTVWLSHAMLWRS
ncbi:hypothetical protein B0T14DRAFT_114307 [Immersiella caudata]|uniref:Uncharacterized protein n=1 Tax=Immersiella caudata TaxID=314043 RepID=A0AA39X4N6_9PEZI|nr:hypothetical protein B0T14DRAFT_114307 [Immersiella caudata]